MSVNTDRDETAADIEAEQRYAELETADTIIVYDRENHNAWLQSDAAVAVAESC